MYTKYLAGDLYNCNKGEHSVIRNMTNPEVILHHLH